MDSAAALFVLAAGLSYLYAFVGGFTDAANAIATSVSTRVLTPRHAVIVAGVFNLAGGMTGTAVAATIGKGLVEPHALRLVTVIAALGGAMMWSLFTYRMGIPVSETHGLIGGLMGAAVSTAGFDAVQWAALTKVGVAIIASPLIGIVAGMTLILTVYRVCQHIPRGRAMPWFVNLQRLSAAYMAFSHGRNDAQKPMGVLALALALHFGWPEVTVPIWVVVTCAGVAAMGTAYGGWRIIRTLGQKITRLDPVQGFAAEVAGGSVIQLASQLGIPVSTTHTLTAAILGVGLSKRRSAVRWTIFANIFFSWLLTVPVTFALGFLLARLFTLGELLLRGLA